MEYTTKKGVLGKNIFNVFNKRDTAYATHREREKEAREAT